MSTTPTGERPAAALAVDPVEVTPGFAARVPVLVTSQLTVPAMFLLEVVGLDPQWVTSPGPIGPVAPGQQVLVELLVTVPAGHPAAHLRSSIRASAVSDGADAQDAGRPGATDLEVVVGDGSLIAAVLEPPEVRGAWRGRFDVVLFNRARGPLRVDLKATSPDPTVRVRLRQHTEVLAPGKEVRVRGRVDAHRPMVGSPKRRPFAVRVQGRTTPVAVEGTFHQRAVIGASLTRVVAVGLVVALWAAVAAVGIRTLDSRLKRSALQRQTASNPPPPAEAQPAGGSGTGSGQASSGNSSQGGSASGGGSTSGGSGGGATSGGSGGGSTSGGSGGGSTSGGSGGGSTSGGSGGGSTSGGSGGGSTSGGGGGEGGSTSGGSGGGSTSGGGGGGGGSTSGGNGGGSTSGGNGGGSTSGGNGGGSTSGGGASAAPAGAGVTGGTTRVSGQVAAAQPDGVTVSIAPTSLVDEAAQGASSANQTTAAIQTAAYVVKGPSRAQAPIGKIYGAFGSPSTSTALTAADQPTITTTTTPDGSWAFQDIRAPGDYLVTFSKPGYGTQRYIVTVGPDGKPVKLSASISPGGGALSGTVSGPSGPLGNVNVMVTDGTVTVEAKTPTVGPVGTWSVSGLSTPDTYLVMATATGYSTETALVTLNASGTTGGVNLTMHPGEGSITGTVTAARTGKGAGGVTVTATNGSITRTATSTTTTPVGSYALPDLPIPGTYAVTISGSGWVSQTQLVRLTGNSVVNAALTPSGADVNGVVSGSDGTGLAGAGIVLSNDTNTFKTLTQSASPVGGFDFGQIPPGEYVLTATDFGFTTQSAQVSVGPGQTQTVNLTLPFVGQANQDTATIQGAVQDLFNATPLGPPDHVVSLALDHVPTSATTNAQGNYVIPNVGPGVHTVTASAAGFEQASVSVSVALGTVAFAPVIGLPKLDTVAGQVRSNAGGFVPNPCAQLADPKNPTVILFQSAACTTPPPVPDPTFPGIPPAAIGGFEIDNVPHGNYDLILSGSAQTGCNVGAGFISNVKNPVAISLTLDTDLVLTGTQSPALDLGPVFTVITLEATAGGGVPTQIGGATVTVTDVRTGQQSSCTSPDPPPPGSPPTPTVVPNLTFGDPYRATFTAPDGATAPPIAFTAILNNSTVNTALLYTPPSVGRVTLQFNFTTSGTTTACLELTTAAPPCPAAPDLSQVQMTGTVGFAFSSPGQPGAPIQKTFTAKANGDGTWSFAQSDINQLLPSGSVSFAITDPVGAFLPFVVSASPTSGGAIGPQLFTLTPASVAIRSGILVGTITPTSGVTVTVSPPIQGASIVDAGGVLVWSTTSTSVQAQPGVYTLTFTAPGFDSQTASYTVPFFPGTPFANIGQITLTAHVTLTVTPTFTPQPGLAFPTVFLFDTTSGTPAQVGQQTLSPTVASAPFGNLSVKDSFQVVIRGPGFATSTTTVALSGDTTITPALSAEGFITGTLLGQINQATSPLTGVTVTARVTGTPPAGGCPSDTLTAPTVTTATDGTFTIIGDPSKADGGLCNGATYTLGAQVFGYANASATVAISSTAANAAPSLVAVANKIVQKVVVEDQDGNAITGLGITNFSSIGSAVTFTQEADKVTYDLTIDPTTYTFIFAATGYTTQSLGPIPYTPGESPPSLRVNLLLNKNTITGIVTTPGPGGSTVPLPGVTVSLFPDTPGAPAFTSVTTDSKGVYKLTDEGTTLNFIPDGTYILGATLPGYTFRVQPQAFQTTLPNTIVNLSLAPDRVNVSVAITSTLGASSNLTGATVTLTPVTPAGTVQACGTGSQLVPGLGAAQSVSVASSAAAFNQVIPDVYTLTASAPNHPAQTGTRLTVCPDGSTSPSPATFQFQEGAVTGTVAVPAGSGLLASSVTVNLFAGGSPTGTPQPLTVSCSPAPASCTSGTFSTFVALASAYTAQASLTGLTTQTQTTLSLTAANPSATLTLTLPAATREVDVTVTSGGTTPILLAAGTVTLSLPAGSQPFSGTAQTYTGTVSSGVAKITGVAPSAAAYTIGVADGPVTASGSVSVPIGTGTVAPTVTAAFGQISGTVALSPAPSAPTAVTATVCASAAGCATPVSTATITVATSGTASYTFQLPPSSGAGDLVTFSATGYDDQTTAALTVTDGATTTAPAVTLSPPPPPPPPPPGP